MQLNIFLQGSDERNCVLTLLSVIISNSFHIQISFCCSTKLFNQQYMIILVWTMQFCHSRFYNAVSTSQLFVIISWVTHSGSESVDLTLLNEPFV